MSNKTAVRDATLLFMSETGKENGEAENLEPAGAPQAPETQREGETPAIAESAPQKAPSAPRNAAAVKRPESIQITLTDEPKSKRIHILLRPSAYARLEKAARSDRVSVNEWINEAIVEKLERDET